jgi:hypothetical protein
MLKRRSCCFANSWFRGVGVPFAMMAYPVKKNDWAAMSQASRCTIKLSSCWIWSRIVWYQSRGLRESRESFVRGPDMGRDKGMRGAVQNGTDMAYGTYESRGLTRGLSARSRRCRSAHSPLRFYSAGWARGSRSLVPPGLGEVTNGPPARGALSLKATSGISLGLPSSGKSFLSGKKG